MNLFSKMLFLDGLQIWATNLFNSVFWSGILKLLGVLLYSFSVALFSVMDFLASFFRRIVGLDGGVSIAGEQVTGDIVLSLIQSREVMNVFIALLVVAVFLLFVSTIVAIIKSEYNFDKGGNAKGPIFGRAIKALFYFLSVPTVCVFGVWMANQLLSVLDQATGGGGQDTHLSSLVFAACCNNANRIGNDDEFWSAYRQSENVSGAGGGRAFFVQNVSLSGNDIPDDTDVRQQIALALNDAFKNETPVKNIHGSGNDTYNNLFTWSFDASGFGRPQNVTESQAGFKWHYGLSMSNVKKEDATFSVYDINLVWFYYNLITYDHLISLLASFLILKALFDLCMGVTKRIYEMIVLFCVSPPIVALMPLDEGAAYKNWTKAFVGKTLAAYGGVLAINFFFMLVPVLQTINVFDNISFGIINMTGVFNYFAQLIMIIAGAVSLSSISEMISKLIGADDALKDGGAVGKATLGGMASAIGFGVGAGKLMGKGVKAIANLPKNALNAGQQLGKDFKNIAAGSSRTDAIESTTSEIADETGSIPTPDASSAVGSGSGDSTPPSGGGGGPSGGSGGGGGAPSSGASKGQPFGDKVYDKAGKLAHVTGNYLREGATAKGVGRAFMQTGKATAAMGRVTKKATGAVANVTGKATARVADSAAKSFSHINKRNSFIKNAGHFAAGVAKTIATGATGLVTGAATGLAAGATAVGLGLATGATAVGGALRTAGRSVGMVARMGGAVIKNFAAPAAKSVARGVGAATGLVTGAVTGGESSKVSNAAKAAFSSPEQRAARRNARDRKNARYDDEIQQKKLKKQYKQEHDALRLRYSGDDASFNRELEILRAGYRRRGLKKFE